MGKKKQKVHPGDPAPRAGWSLHGLNHDHPSTACWHMQHTDPLWSPLPSSPPSSRILCTRNTNCIASSHLTSTPPEMLSVNLECYLPPPDLNLPGACLPLCYIDPELHPELLNWSLELKPGKVLQAILNAVGFHLSLRVMDLSNTKEEEHPQCLSPDPIQGNMDGFPDILASLTGVTQMTVLHCKQRTGTRPKLSLSSRGRTHTFTLVLSGQVASDSLQPHGLQPARLPCPQYCPSKNTGIGYHFLLQDTHRSLTEMPQQVSIDHFDLAGFLGKNTTLRVGSSTRITLHPPSLPRLP